MIKVKDAPQYEKHSRTGALINNDVSAYRNAKNTKKRILDSIQKQKDLEDKLVSLEEKVNKILRTKDKVK